MTPLTHNITGIALGIAGAAILSPPESWFFLGGCIAGARAPDWLEIAGYNKRKEQRWSVIPHRTITHWPWLWAPITGLATLLLLGDVADTRPLIAIIGFAASCLLHIGMDYLTPAGVPLGLNPFGKHASARIMRTGSAGEILVSVVAFAVIGAAWTFGEDP